MLAWEAFAGPAARITELTGYELGANIAQHGPKGYMVEELRVGLESGVNVPEYRGDGDWVATIHTHPVANVGEPVGFSGGAYYVPGKGFEYHAGDIGFAASVKSQRGVNAYVRQADGRFAGGYREFFLTMLDFKQAAATAVS